jgi:hypothetical protein
MGERRGVYRLFVGSLRERDHLGDSGVDRRIIIIRIFSKWDVGIWTGSSWFGIRTGGWYLRMQ